MESAAHTKSEDISETDENAFESESISTPRSATVRFKEYRKELQEQLDSLLARQDQVEHSVSLATTQKEEYDFLEFELKMKEEITHLFIAEEKKLLPVVEKLEKYHEELQAV